MSARYAFKEGGQCSFADGTGSYAFRMVVGFSGLGDVGDVEIRCLGMYGLDGREVW